MSVVPGPPPGLGHAPPSGTWGYDAARAPRHPQDGYRVNQTPTPVGPSRVVTAPTLGQYVKSDSRAVPGRKAPKWAGRAAFWVGMLATGLYILANVTATAVLASIAAPFAIVALFFALIAIIAGIGRGLGVFGLVFALAGLHVFWLWLEALFG